MFLDSEKSYLFISVDYMSFYLLIKLGVMIVKVHSLLCDTRLQIKVGTLCVYFIHS